MTSNLPRRVYDFSRFELTHWGFDDLVGRRADNWCGHVGERLHVRGLCDGPRRSVCTGGCSLVGLSENGVRRTWVERGENQVTTISKLACASTSPDSVTGLGL